MNKIKNIFTVVIFTSLIYSCSSSSSSTVDDFDYEAQALIDNDSLVSFFKKYYFDTSLDSIKPIVSGKTALFNDDNLKTMDISENEIDYKLYYYVTRVGDPDPVKGFPSVMDSILSNYQVWNIPRTDTISLQETGTKANWWNLSPSTGGAPTPIRGWAYGFTNFKAGKNVTNNGPITYENSGKGILFIPSGLAYPTGSSANLAGYNLIFYIDLYDFIENTDHDSDGVASILEDPDGDGDPRNDDTDGNNLPNYLDPDDDGDGVLTKNEDTNGDGNPANDFSDPNNPTLADYLNPDIK